ncbi:MAG TPA: hypothetical protein VGA01_09490 [Candidatus Binatia bacterium]
MRLRKSSAPQRDPSERPHAGHVAAFGAKLAILLSREGIRHTALTPDHVIWCKELNTLKALGWSHVETLTWPNDARQHLQDIRVFLQSCGTESTSALRLGYSFQLGPVAEWIFFDLLDSTTPEVSEPVPPFLLEQWTSPSRDLALKDDSTLSKKGESRCFEQGCDALRQKRFPDARRFFLRYLLGALASGDTKLQNAGLFNLCVVLSNERRWIRAFGLGVIAAASSLEDQTMTQEIVLPFIARMRGNLSDDEEAAVFAMIPAGEKRSIPELIWRIDDLDIRTRLNQHRGI